MTEGSDDSHMLDFALLFFMIFVLLISSLKFIEVAFLIIMGSFKKFVLSKFFSTIVLLFFF